MLTIARSEVVLFILNMILDKCIILWQKAQEKKKRKWGLLKFGFEPRSFELLTRG